MAVTIIQRQSQFPLVFDGFLSCYRTVISLYRQSLKVKEF